MYPIKGVRTFHYNKDYNICSSLGFHLFGVRAFHYNKDYN